MIEVKESEIKEFIRVSEDMHWVLSEISKIAFLREEIKNLINPILEKYEEVYPKTYKW